MKKIRTYQFLFIGLVFLFSCDINKYDLEKKDIVNYSFEYSNVMEGLKLGLRSTVLQHSLDSSYYIPVVSVSNRLSIAHVSKEGMYLTTLNLSDASSLVDFKEIGNFYYALVQYQDHIKVVKLAKDFNVVTEWSMENFVAGTSITSTRGGHLFYDLLSNNIYVGGICTDALQGDQMIMMSLDLDLFPVWSDIKKYFDNAIATSTVSSENNYLMVTGNKSDESPFYLKMNRFGNLLDNIFLLDELALDSLNEARLIGADLYLTGTTILPNKQAVIARIDTLNQSIISFFGIGCNAIESRCNNFEVDLDDGSFLALAENFMTQEIHLTKFNYESLSLDWNQCYPNLFQADHVVGLGMIKSLDLGYMVASLESSTPNVYYLRLTKTDRLGEVRFD